MDSPKHVMIRDYSYELPDDRVAQYPLDDRDASKLLIYKEGQLTDGSYRDLATFIPAPAFLVLNDTKVIPARLLFRKPTGGQVEVFCLEPLDMEPSRAMKQQGNALWKCLIGAAGKWKSGWLERVVEGADGSVYLRAEKIGVVPDGYQVRLTWTPDHLHFAEVLHYLGSIPLPPYLHRMPDPLDKERYQTFYAQAEGSVAAPTAGLHFTPRLMENLHAKGIQSGFVTLHVGAGTFKPVKADLMADHVMHAEWLSVHRSFIRALQQAKGPIIPVGTTALRTLESLYWMGVKVLQKEIADMESLALTQWEVYDDLPQDVKKDTALQGLLDWLDRQNGIQVMTRTQLLIAPPYRARIADALVTNFHQPGSTLLLLIGAVVGSDWRKIYAHALERNFRFLSYGDGCLLWFSRYL